MMKKPFTLLEMLLVMAIIGILTAILIPLLSKVQNTSKVNQAKTEVNTMKMAVDAFYTDYSYLPYDGDLQDQTFIGKYEGADVLEQTIGAQEVSNSIFGTTGICRDFYDALQLPCQTKTNLTNTAYECETYHYELKKNPNSVRYLPRNYTKRNKLCDSDTIWCYKRNQAHLITAAYDPWSRPYLFYLDGDADGQIEVHPSFNLVGNKLSNHVGVVSLGSRLKGTVDDVLSKKKDIVTSW